MNPQTPAATRVLTLSHQGRKLPVRFPANGNMEAHVRAILTGETYPFYGVPGRPGCTIVDIGANVGAAAIYFLAKAPEARLIAFEPAAATFALLQENLGAFARAEVVNAGLFSRDTVMDLYGGALDCSQNSVVASSETAAVTERITLRRASSEFGRLGIGEIAILKIDTEGCEVPILEDIAAWLPRVDQIYLEYHSEEDRLAIDAMLADGFMLCRARCDGPHRGVNLYVARRVIEADPRTEPLRLRRPT